MVLIQQSIYIYILSETKTNHSFPSIETIYTLSGSSTLLSPSSEPQDYAITFYSTPPYLSNQFLPLILPWKSILTIISRHNMQSTYASS